MNNGNIFDSRDYLKSVRHSPGVYRMYSPEGQLLYVGKARDVRNRLGSYFAGRPGSPKIEAMLRRLGRIEVDQTASEVEALLLECNLIKKYRPRYNVVLRDDKSYPYLRLDTGLEFPRLVFYRGVKRQGVRYFGPFPSAGAARATLSELRRVFRIRNCSDLFFRNRKRPCLQYQIGRCSAPCVGLIDRDEYNGDVSHAIAFLEGHDETVIEDLMDRMQQASVNLRYEQAARIRDQIQQLRKIQARQAMVTGVGDCDVLGIAVQGPLALVEVLPVREGRVLESQRHYLKTAGEDDPSAILSEFISQHYLERAPPPRLIISRPIADGDLLTSSLKVRWVRQMSIQSATGPVLRRLVGLARENAQMALEARGSEQLDDGFRALEEALGMPVDSIRKIECFDISHTQGEQTRGSCVVFNRDGPVRSAYRRYRIAGVTAGDDYAALAQVLDRRYRKLVEHKSELPDLVLVDGGGSQVRRSLSVLSALGLCHVAVAGVTKGAGRRASLDRLVSGSDGQTVPLRSGSPGLRLVQSLRDEAHRFAITAHRKARARHSVQSPLELVAGIGPVRRQALLTRFGGLKGLRAATAEDLVTIPGISRFLAERIVQYLGELK